MLTLRMMASCEDRREECCSRRVPDRLGRPAHLAGADILWPVLANPHLPPPCGAARRAHQRHRRVLTTPAAPPVVAVPARLRVESRCPAMLTARGRRAPVACGSVGWWLPNVGASLPVPPRRRSAGAGSCRAARNAATCAASCACMLHRPHSPQGMPTNLAPWRWRGNSCPILSGTRSALVTKTRNGCCGSCHPSTRRISPVSDTAMSTWIGVWRKPR